MTPIERMARAMWEENGRGDGQGRDVEWDSPHNALREFYIADARAALTALREPSEGMVMAGVESMEAGGLECQDMPPLCEDARDAWQAMIDKALEE